MAARPWVRWGLVASLGLNLALVGLIAGAALHGPPPVAAGPGLWHYARALPEPYRKDLGRALRASRGEWIGAREALAAQREAMAATLTAEPFDAEALRTVLARERVFSDELSDRGAALLVEQIARMSPAERATYAEALREDRRRRHGRRR